MQHLALKATIVLLAVALQKPGQRSKAKEHQECLKKRLTLWRNGEIGSYYAKGEWFKGAYQSRTRMIHQIKREFLQSWSWRARLIRPWDILVKMTAEEYYRWPDDVVRQLGEKHPEAQRAKLGSLLFGPVEEIPDLVYQEINGELVRKRHWELKGLAALRVWTPMVSRGSWHASHLRDQVSTCVSLLLHSQEDCAQSLLIRLPLSLS